MRRKLEWPDPPGDDDPLDLPRTVSALQAREAESMARASFQLAEGHTRAMSKAISFAFVTGVAVGVVLTLVFL